MLERKYHLCWSRSKCWTIKPARAEKFPCSGTLRLPVDVPGEGVLGVHRVQGDTRLLLQHLGKWPHSVQHTNIGNFLL